MTLWIELAGGLALLLAGGEALVRGSAGLARRMGMPPYLIGVTLVGFGTSTPELVTSLDAALIGAPGVAVGNVIGSNIANVLLILGVAAIALPIAVPPGALRRDGAVLIGASGALLAVALTGALSRAAGLAFLAALVVYLWVSLRSARTAGSEAESGQAAAPGLGAGIALAAAGVAGVVLGAHLLVGGAVALARTTGVSEAAIGLTLVAVGTSLPELATSLVAALRRQGDIALGNVIGSNIFNILGIAGTTAAVAPIAVPAEILRLDIWVMAGTALLLVAAAATGRRIGRPEGAAFLAGYAAYLALLLAPQLSQAAP